MPDYGLQLLRCHLSGVAEINLVVVSLICDIQCISLLINKLMHPRYCFRLSVISTDVDSLKAKTRVIGQEFNH